MGLGHLLASDLARVALMVVLLQWVLMEKSTEEIEDDDGGVCEEIEDDSSTTWEDGGFGWVGQSVINEHMV